MTTARPLLVTVRQVATPRLAPMEGATPATGEAVPAEPGAGAPPPAVDGRTARAQRTRDAIVEACVQLVKDGDIRPTAPRIAEQAGVSVRSVFQHFDDLETLFSMVTLRSFDGLGALIRPISTDLPVEARVEALVSQRVELLEAITPIRRAAAVHAPFSPSIQQGVAAGQQFLRSQVAAAFEPELTALAESRREQVLHMLTTVTGWPSWEMMRTLDDLDVAQARTVVIELVWSVLDRAAAAKG